MVTITATPGSSDRKCIAKQQHIISRGDVEFVTEESCVSDKAQARVTEKSLGMMFSPALKGSKLTLGS